MAAEVYVFVDKALLWKRHEKDPGMWLDPDGGAHPMTAAEAEALLAEHPEVEVTIEPIAVHQRRSREQAAREAAGAASAEGGE